MEQFFKELVHATEDDERRCDGQDRADEAGEDREHERVLPIAVAHDVDLAVVVGQRSEQVAVDFDEEVRAAEGAAEEVGSAKFVAPIQNLDPLVVPDAAIVGIAIDGAAVGRIF